MHVAYIVGQNSGGLPHYTAELANAVSDHARVTVLKPTETSADDMFDDDVELVDAFSPIELSTAKFYRREINPLDALAGLASYAGVEAIRRLDPDVVHDPTDLFPQVKFFLQRQGIDAEWPVVVTRHEVELNRFSLARPTHLAEDLVLAAIPDLDVARTVVHTENQRRALVEQGHDPRSISVIPHGAYTVFGDHAAVDRDPEDDCLLFFGNIVPHKGLDTLADAVEIVKREVPDVTVIVAGEGQISDPVTATMAEHDGTFEVKNHYVPNDGVKDLFGRAQLVVLPYHQREGGTNGHSGVLATAASFGRPVVTSKAGDFPTLVEGYDCGLTVPSEDSDALAAAIVSLLEDDERRREMAANSRALADDLSWDSIAEEYVDVYEAAVRTRRKARGAPGRP